MRLNRCLNTKSIAFASLAVLILTGMVPACAEETLPPGEGTAVEEEVVEIIEVTIPEEEGGVEGPEAAIIDSLERDGIDKAAAERGDKSPANQWDGEEPESVKGQGTSTGITPLFVRALTGIESGRNDSNPQWSPNGKWLSFERSMGERKEILIASLEGTILHKLYYQRSDKDDDLGFLLPGFLEDASYNAGISWSPDGARFVYMSNAGTGNYDLYLSGLGAQYNVRLTEDPAKEGHAHWSPASDNLAYISGKEGGADVYLMNLSTRAVTRLTRGEKAFLYPQWSPDGGKLAMIYGSNENHDIYLMEDVGRPDQSLRPLTDWPYDDLRPVWSPDGKNLAFYSNFNEYNDPKVWSLMVGAADGSDTKGKAPASRVVATDVIPDIERGPAWMPDSRRIVYVKNDPHAYNPLYVTDINAKTSVPLITGTRMNHDVACSVDGTIAFRAQVEQWDHMFVARLK